MKAARILVVDDDLWIQRTTASVLGQQGHQVSLAGDAPSAFALASRIRPDVVVTTVSLPALDGWSWWERLRALPACARTPIVFLLPPGDDRRDRGRRAAGSAAAQAVPRWKISSGPSLSVLGEQPVETATSASAPAAATAAVGRPHQAVGRPPPAVRAARRAGSDLAVERARRARDGAQERHPAGGARARDGPAVPAPGSDHPRRDRRAGVVGRGAPSTRW